MAGASCVCCSTRTPGLGKPDSLAYLWQPKLRGKVAIRDHIEAIYMAARYLGYKNTYDLSDDQLQHVKTALIALKPRYTQVLGDDRRNGHTDAYR